MSNSDPFADGMAFFGSEIKRLRELYRAVGNADIMREQRDHLVKMGNPQGNCVEVARNIPGAVAVRDSKDPHGPILRFARDEWARLIDRVKADS
jgi:hypothetical protein